MNPFAYFKAVIGAVGATVLPPIFEWLALYIPGAPPNVRTSISMLLIALVTGGVVYVTPNQQKEIASSRPQADHA